MSGLLDFFEHLFHRHTIHPVHQASIQQTLENIMTALEQLQADITNDATIKAGAIAMIVALAKQVADLVAATQNGVDPAALALLSTQLQAQSKALQDAVDAVGAPATPAP